MIGKRERERETQVCTLFEGFDLIKKKQMNELGERNTEARETIYLCELSLEDSFSTLFCLVCDHVTTTKNMREGEEREKERFNLFLGKN